MHVKEHSEFNLFRFRLTSSPYKGCIITNATVLLVCTPHSWKCLLPDARCLPYFVPRSMAPCRFHTIDWLLGRWVRPSISHGTVKHDLADLTCDLCVVQYPSFTTVCRQWSIRRHEPIAVLPVRFCCIVHMV